MSGLTAPVVENDGLSCRGAGQPVIVPRHAPRCDSDVNGCACCNEGQHAITMDCNGPSFKE